MPLKLETPQDTSFLKKKSINCDGKILILDEPAIMGILNVTPDSFFDGGKYLSEENIVERVNSMEYDGAAIVDVGGYSSRPNANDVPENIELNRVLPVIQLIRSNFPNIIISVDTFRSKVAEKCVEAGAGIINDISGGTLDSNMYSCVANLKVPYVLMHMQGTPQTMQNNPSYTNVIEEVKAYFSEKIEQLESYGIADIILDPGFGFGKSLEHNYELLKHLDSFRSFGLPMLAGFSRKSMINKVLLTEPEEALTGTTVLNTIGLMKGVNILRVHDVKEAQDAIKLVAQLKY